MSLRIEVIESLAEVSADAWDALVGEDDPFVEHAFLRALETSESVGVEAGWQPLHVTVWREETLIGALPLYAKGHSWGEFIFDFAWARAAQQAGIDYYPKLVSMAPFTPATGTRLLMRPGEDAREITAALIAGARHLAEEVDASSLHLLFLTPEERAHAVAAGLRPRLSYQFHWRNEGYATFDDFLAKFRSDKRKQVRKERRCVTESGLRIEVKEGPALSDADWSALARFYREGVRRYGSYPYLTPAFFDALRATHARRVVVFLAYEGSAPVASSLCFEKGAHLYGRYWGTRQGLSDQEFLHFELCYYRPIERAITRGLRRFEAGAQGTHKMKRGMLPNEVHSAHWIREPRLAAAVDEHLPLEAGQVKAEMALLSERSPFHRG
jgi:predicted N-acyltransferase